MTAATPGGLRPDPTEAAPRGRRPEDTFSNRLLLVIRLTELSIRDFAEEAGLDDGSVSNWTRGMRPRYFAEVCRAIADAHDIDLMWLMQGGPLQPARGLPTGRTKGLSPGSIRRSVRAIAARSNARGGGRSPAWTTRRPRLIARTQPLAA